MQQVSGREPELFLSLESNGIMESGCQTGLSLGIDSAEGMGLLKVQAGCVLDMGTSDTKGRGAFEDSLRSLGTRFLAWIWSAVKANSAGHALLKPVQVFWGMWEKMSQLLVHPPSWGLQAKDVEGWCRAGSCLEDKSG